MKALASSQLYLKKIMHITVTQYIGSIVSTPEMNKHFKKKKRIPTPIDILIK